MQGNFLKEYKMIIIYFILLAFVFFGGGFFYGHEFGYLNGQQYERAQRYYNFCKVRKAFNKESHEKE